MQTKTKLYVYLKPFFGLSVFVSVCVFNVWPKTTLLLPVWPRDAKSLDTPTLDSLSKLNSHVLKFCYSVS